HTLMFCVVHGGAGYHGREDEKVVMQALRTACACAHTCSTSLDAVESAIVVMEDDPCLNAGYGANLTIDGNVECDAAIAGSFNAFGSVGAVAGLRNPVRAARAVLNQSLRPGVLGRVPPLTLVSTGAKVFAESHGVETVANDALVAPRALKEWKLWSQRLAEAQKGNDLSASRLLQDTVGAAAWHPSSGPAAGVSSGGLLLKLSGRVGEAAIYGAGCWAESYSGGAVACSVSAGTGEYIVRAVLARTLCESIVAAYDDRDVDIHALLQTAIIGNFWSTGTEPVGESFDHLSNTVVPLKPCLERIPHLARLWCAFTTPSMAVGYVSPSKSPKVRYSTHHIRHLCTSITTRIFHLVHQHLHCYFPHIFHVIKVARRPFTHLHADPMLGFPPASHGIPPFPT
ncbi:N-terminal nucleophile aminohydrolase, partial [Fistulina hepatica ATCC 64428]